MPAMADDELLVPIDKESEGGIYTLTYTYTYTYTYTHTYKYRVYGILIPYTCTDLNRQYPPPLLKEYWPKGVVRGLIYIYIYRERERYNTYTYIYIYIEREIQMNKLINK